MGSQRALPAVIALALAAHAANADPKAEAKAHIEKAMVLHGELHYSEALEELQLAYALDPQPDVLYAIGQVYVKLERCTDAITYYQRFLESKPPSGPAGAAKEAISVCRKRLAAQPQPKPEPKPEPKPQPDAKPQPEPLPEPKPEPKPEPEPQSQPQPDSNPTPGPEPEARSPQPEGHSWYADPLGDALVGAGVISGVVGIVLYRGASSDLDSAEHASTYQASLDLIDHAHTKRTEAIVLGGAGVALIGVGIGRLVMHGGSHEAIAVAPTRGGSLVTWSGAW